MWMVKNREEAGSHCRMEKSMSKAGEKDWRRKEAVPPLVKHGDNAPEERPIPHCLQNLVNPLQTNMIVCVEKV
jgi:hypothetical protein